MCVFERKLDSSLKAREPLIVLRQISDMLKMHNQPLRYVHCMPNSVFQIPTLNWIFDF